MSRKTQRRQQRYRKPRYKAPPPPPPRIAFDKRGIPYLVKDGEIRRIRVSGGKLVVGDVAQGQEEGK